MIHVTSNWASLGAPPGGGGGIDTTGVGVNVDGRLEIFISDSNATAIWHISQLPNGEWSAWSSLSAPSNKSFTASSVGKNVDGRLEVFDSDIFISGELWHIWQTPDGGWAAWSDLGTPNEKQVLASQQYSLATNADGRLEVFAAYIDRSQASGTIWHAWQLLPRQNEWSTWSSLGAPNDKVTFGNCATVTTKGRLEVFVIGTDQALWHIGQTAPGQW